MNNITLLERFDKMSKVLCLSSNVEKVTLKTRRGLNGYQKEFEFSNRAKISVVCHDLVNLDENHTRIEVSFLPVVGQNSTAGFDKEIRIYDDVEDVNEYLLEIAEAPAWVF